MGEDASASTLGPAYTEPEATRRKSYFRSVARYWERLYQDQDLTARVYQERRDASLSWVKHLSLVPAARVLDLGCGPGFTAVALAKEGYSVNGLDFEQSMLDMAACRAQGAGVSLKLALGDAHEIAFDDATFDLVVALGLIPWLHSPHKALREIFRVLKPGAFLVVSSDNRRRLTHWFDPIYNPALASFRKLVASTLRKWGWMRMPKTCPPTMQSTPEFDLWLTEAGFTLTNSATIGFGPFTLFRRDVLPDRIGATLHGCLQRLADAGWPWLRNTGAHYLVLARKASALEKERPALTVRGKYPQQPEAHACDVSTPVVVLGANTHGSLGIMRSLGRLGVSIHAVSSPPRGPASFSAYCKSVGTWDFAHAKQQDTAAYLLELAHWIGARSILIPTWDEMAVFTAEFRNILTAGFIYPCQPKELPRSLCDKRQMAALARQFGVPTPGVSFPRSLDDVLRYIDAARFPIMLKGIDGNKLKERTGMKMVIAYSPRQLREMYLALEDPENPNLMLQEYIPGGDDSIWMFNGYFNASSECLFGATGRKLRQTPIHTGMTSLGVCLKNDDVERTTRWFMRALGYKGILDIGYRYDARDGQYKVLDINPRIGATFRLFLGDNGLDVARALYLDLTGQEVPVSRPRQGRKWFVESDLKSCVDYYREGSLTLSQWLNSLRGIEEAGYFAWDDLGPFWKICWRALFDLIAHARRPAKRLQGGNPNTRPHNIQR
jgi:predicted ATP-grasp superfamily ATP-dependent carboligase/ubiquinone/menaquinone biosynthesis C-methylase UbiE